MKTIIQVVQHLTPGGIEVMAIELKKCNDESARMLIVSLEGTKEDAIERWPRLKPYAKDLFFLDKKPGLDLSLPFKLMRIFIDNDVEVAHTHHIGPLIYGGLAARLASLPKLIHTEHDAWHLQDSKRRRVEKLAIFLTRPQLVADATIVAQGMEEHLNKKDIHVVKNGINVEQFCPGDPVVARYALDLPKNAKIIGSSGRLESVKGHRKLIEAMRFFADTNIHLAIAGQGSLDVELKELTRSLSLENRVHFLGQVDNMTQFYRAIDVFCLPSLREGMPLAPLEAQACGVPAVITDTGGARETLCKKAGYLVPPGNSHALYSAIARVLNRAMYIDPRPFVEQFGNISSMAKSYADLCKIGKDVA